MPEYYLSARGERGQLMVAHRLHLEHGEIDRLVDLVDRSNPINMTSPTWRTRVTTAGLGLLVCLLILAASFKIGG